MSPAQAFFGGKRVTVLGLGLLGRGAGDAAFIAQSGGIVTVTDVKSREQLAASVERLAGLNVLFHLGGHERSDFTNADMVIKAAGVRLDSQEVAAAREAGVPVYMSTALFARFARDVGARIVGVTGTRGKSTVTHLIAHVLTKAGRRVHLGGNVRGVSTLALTPEIREGDVCVLELDSWQLQGFGDLGISPDVAVFTNLMPDHQNYYPDMETYFNDKANIFRAQHPRDVLVCGTTIAPQIREASPPIEPQVPQELPVEWQLRIPGTHNRENAALAAAALRGLGVAETEIREGLETFEGVEGRLQFVREVRGVKIYNDNNATTPEATIAALRALDDGTRRIILIMGGADKGLEVGNLLYQIAGACKRVILLAGSGTDRVAPLMQDYSLYDEFESAVREAFASASEGDVVLLSPAFASFGIFANEYERNDRFLAVVRSLE